MANNNEIEDWDAELAHNTGRMRFIRGYWTKHIYLITNSRRWLREGKL